jgi:hypothetical protein
MYLNEKKDKELALWSQAITGCIYTDIFSRRKKIQEYNTIAIQHFEKAVEMDASFIDIVGLDLANAYKNVEDSTSLQNVIKTYKRMIKSSRDNMLIYQKLFDIYSVQNNEEEYFIALEQAFKNGLYIPEDKINRSQYKKFNKLEQFKTLVSKYNERNKPLFLTN